LHYSINDSRIYRTELQRRREAVKEMLAYHTKSSKIINKFDLKPSTVYTLAAAIRKREMPPYIINDSIQRRKPKLTDAHLSYLKDYLEGQRNKVVTLKMMRRELIRKYPELIPLSISTIHRAIKIILKMRYKQMNNRPLQSDTPAIKVHKL
jgi:transposase